jgi:hypothetical protein
VWLFWQAAPPRSVEPLDRRRVEEYILDPQLQFSHGQSGVAMRESGSHLSRRDQTPSGGTRPRPSLHVVAWPFVYIFFTNGIPFDSPNRSEPCPTA